MSEQAELFDEGRERRDEGIRRVIENAGDAWGAAYLVTVQMWFAALPAGSEFTGEDLRLQVEPIIGKPHHSNAWGGKASTLISQWLKNHTIERCGVREAITAKAHARRYPLYRKCRL